MAISIQFTNDTKYQLYLDQYNENRAPSIDLNESPAQVLAPYASTNYVTADPQSYGTGSETLVIFWKEPTTNTRFGIHVEYPLSIASVHLGDYVWGYQVSPAPQGVSADWTMHSSSSLDNTALTTPVTIHNINSQFLFAIQPNLTADLMTFSVTIGPERTS
jgi:hypothetical protein